MVCTCKEKCDRNPHCHIERCPLCEAATDLLEALTVLVADVEETFTSFGVGHMQAKTVVDAKKAIAKATGKTE